MPFHGTEVLDPTIDKWMRLMRVETALDVGVGSGSRGQLIRLAHPDARIIGYETEADYAAAYNLRTIYDDLRLQDVMELVDGNGEEHYDLVYLGDVIEHLRRSDGIDLLHYLIYRTKHLLVSYPERFMQDAWEGHSSEAHRSVWSQDDFKMFEPLWTGRVELPQLPGVAICVLIHGFGYLATADDRRPFESKGDH